MLSRTAAAALAPTRALLAKAASAAWLALVLAVRLPMTLAVLLAMSWSLSLSALGLAVLLVSLVLSRSAAAAPPSTSLPSGITGRRIRSLIHVALLVTFVSPRIADSHICEPHLLAVLPDSGPRISASLRLESFLKSNQLRPSGAWNLWREERQHGKCGDWRTS